MHIICYNAFALKFFKVTVNCLPKIISLRRLCRTCHLMTKPTKWHMRPAKTLISLGIRPVWSESSLIAWKKAWVLSYPLSAQRRLWTDWADAQADLSLRWVHSHFVGFVMRRLLYYYSKTEFWYSREGHCECLVYCIHDYDRGMLIFCPFFSHVTRKPVFGALWPGKTQTSLLSYTD